MAKVLVVIDVQKEYTTHGRPFFIEGIGPSLNAGKRVLENARKQAMPIIHVRHLQDGDLFNTNGPLSGYVEGFEPIANEIEITKGNFSCFSSPEFLPALNAVDATEIVVIGYGSGMCCLSTIVDGYHRGYKMTFVKDASNAKPKSFDSATTHAHMTDAISTFATVVTADGE